MPRCGRDLSGGHRALSGLREPSGARAAGSRLGERPGVARRAASPPAATAAPAGKGGHDADTAGFSAPSPKALREGIRRPLYFRFGPD